MGEKCPVCGETAPVAWYCINRLNDGAKRSVEKRKRCGYSIEGDQRLTVVLAKASDDLRALAARSPSDGGM